MAIHPPDLEGLSNALVTEIHSASSQPSSLPMRASVWEKRRNCWMTYSTSSSEDDRRLEDQAIMGFDPQDVRDRSVYHVASKALYAVLESQGLVD